MSYSRTRYRLAACSQRRFCLCAASYARAARAPLPSDAWEQTPPAAPRPAARHGASAADAG